MSGTTNCPYCGRENDAESQRCRECGTELRSIDLPPRPTRDLLKQWIRWKAAAIMLWICGVGFALLAVLNLHLAIQIVKHPTQNPQLGGSRRMVSMAIRGMVANAIIAGLCICGWHLMKARTKDRLLTGAFVVLIAFGITFSRWVIWAIKGTAAFDWFEPLLIWPLLIYPTIYGFVESKRIQSCE